MINGCLQMMDSGLVPGNRNADKLREHHHLFFPNINTPLRAGDAAGGIKACSVTSFGFGQKGAQAILVHPKYLFATISKEKHQEYAQKRQARWQRASRSFSEALVHENMVSVCIKSEPPYPVQKEIAALVNPAARRGDFE